MDRGDQDTRLAYYMFVNHGWRPEQVSSLSPEEKAMMTVFAVREIQSRPKPKEGT